MPITLKLVIMKSQGTGEYELGQSEQKGICLVWAKTCILLKKNGTWKEALQSTSMYKCGAIWYYPLEMGKL